MLRIEFRNFDYELLYEYFINDISVAIVNVCEKLGYLTDNSEIRIGWSGCLYINGHCKGVFYVYCDEQLIF